MMTTLKTLMMLMKVLCSILFYSAILSCHEKKVPKPKEKTIKIFTFNYLLDSLQLKPTIVKNNDPNLIIRHYDRDEEWMLELRYERLHDGTWMLVDSSNNKPYLIAQVKGGKLNGLFATGESKTGYVHLFGNYKNDERVGYFYFNSYSGELYLVAKFVEGKNVDSDFLYKNTGELSEIRVLGKRYYSKRIFYGYDGKIWKVEYYDSTPIVIHYYQDGKMVMRSESSN